MADRAALEAVFKKHGFEDFRWIDPGEIVVSQWVRMKCMFGCPGYGKLASCPPNVPPVEECRNFFNEYGEGVIFHIAKRVDKPGDRHAWSKGVNESLSKLEREIFLSGHFKAFLLFMDSCSLCKECGHTRDKCLNPKKSRPSPEGMGVDVYTTVRKFGFPVNVLADYDQTMNRYAFLLVE